MKKGGEERAELTPVRDFTSIRKQLTGLREGFSLLQAKKTDTSEITSSWWEQSDTFRKGSD